MNAVDTNIFVYAVDSGDPFRQQRAELFLDSLPVAETVMPWQVACEFAAVMQRLIRLGRVSGDFPSIVRSARSRFQIILPQRSTLDRSLRIMLDEQVSYWDALLLAACADSGVTRLYSEDLQSRKVIHGVEILNPLQ